MARSEFEYMAARPAQFDEHLVFGRVRDAMGVPRECAPISLLTQRTSHHIKRVISTEAERVTPGLRARARRDGRPQGVRAPPRGGGGSSCSYNLPNALSAERSRQVAATAATKLQLQLPRSVAAASCRPRSAVAATAATAAAESLQAVAASMVELATADAVVDEALLIIKEADQQAAKEAAQRRMAEQRVCRLERDLEIMDGLLSHARTGQD